MPISLPLDVIDLILSYLCGTASIAECALVCRSWLSIARHHLLPPPKVLCLDQYQVAELLPLIDSPESTLSLVTFNTLRLWHNAVAAIDPDNPPRGDQWMSEVDVQDLLARDFISFRSVTSLSLETINWRTLSPSAVTSLHNNFMSKELELKWISFTLPEFCRLLAALTALKKVTIRSGVLFDPVPSTIDTVQISHPSLCHLAFNFPSGSCMFQFFARAIQYRSGITSVSIATSGDIDNLKACGELLEMAGANLRALKLLFVFTAPLPDTDIVYYDLLAFPCNTNLQGIDVTPVNESSIMPLLQGLKMKPHLSQVRLGLDEQDNLERWTGGWLVDDALSAMVLKDPKLIVDLPILHHSWLVVEPPREVLERLEKAYVDASRG